jgi:hypothetical protein
MGFWFKFDEPCARYHHKHRQKKWDDGHRKYRKNHFHHRY